MNNTTQILEQAKADDVAATVALRAGDFETYKRLADRASAARKSVFS